MSVHVLNPPLRRLPTRARPPLPEAIATAIVAACKACGVTPASARVFLEAEGAKSLPTWYVLALTALVEDRPAEAETIRRAMKAAPEWTHERRRLARAWPAVWPARVQTVRFALALAEGNA